MFSYGVCLWTWIPILYFSYYSLYVCPPTQWWLHLLVWAVRLHGALQKVASHPWRVRPCNYMMISVLSRHSPDSTCIYIILNPMSSRFFPCPLQNLSTCTLTQTVQQGTTMRLILILTHFSSYTSYPDLSEASLPQRSPAPPRISLLELIKSRTGDNSAESTAQQLLQHMAEQLTGNPTGGLNMSQTVERRGRVRYCSVKKLVGNERGIG